MYLTYEEYQSFGGTLSANEFVLQEFKARQRLDYLTASRIKNHMAEVPQEVKLCILSLITLQTKTSTEAITANPLLSSFNTDGYSESYGSAADQVALLTQQCNREIQTMLWGVKDDTGTPLLWRGCGPYRDEPPGADAV